MGASRRKWRDDPIWLRAFVVVGLLGLTGLIVVALGSSRPGTEVRALQPAQPASPVETTTPPTPEATNPWFVPTPRPTVRHFTTGLESFNPYLPSEPPCHDAYWPPCIDPTPAGYSGYPDYDCWGGPGAPPFVETRVYLKDPEIDPYNLDEIEVGDGIGCELLEEPQ